MLTVMCPGCGNQQRTNPKIVKKSVKRCVYCGKSFRIHLHVNATRITSPHGELPKYHDVASA